MSDQQKIQRDLRLVESAYDAFDVPPEVRDYVWSTVVALCLYSAANGTGPFHDALEAAGLEVSRLKPPAPKGQARKTAKKPAVKKAANSRAK